MLPFRQAYSVLLEYIFPLFCLGCKKEGEWVCTGCQKQLLCTGVFYCPICHENSPLGLPCPSCQSQSFLTSHIAIIPYNDQGLIGEIIRTAKYHFVEDLFILFQTVIQQFFSQYSKYFSDIDMLVPVPLHKRRIAERGFNQSDYIAEAVASTFRLPVFHPLIRGRYTKHQARLKKQEREKNIKDAFIVIQPVHDKKILLIDDVYTTGSTMQECAKALLEAGATSVRGFSIARG